MDAPSAKATVFAHTHTYIFCLIIASFVKISNGYFMEVITFVRVAQFRRPILCKTPKQENPAWVFCLGRQ